MKLTKPKAPKKPLKYAPKPSETRFIEVDIWQKGGGETIILSSEEVYVYATNIYEDSFEYVKENFLAGSEEAGEEYNEYDIGRTIMGEEGFYFIDRLNKDNIEKILALIKNYSNVVDYSIQIGDRDRYLYAELKIKKDAKEYAKEVEAWENRFEIWQEKHKQYLKDMKAYEEAKKALKTEKLKKQLAELED